MYLLEYPKSHYVFSHVSHSFVFLLMLYYYYYYYYHHYYYMYIFISVRL
jgi:hypothetical protein